VAALAADRYLLRVTIGADAHASLRRAQELMSHGAPDGNPAAIVDGALAYLWTTLSAQSSPECDDHGPDSTGRRRL
jgi:hypothetical protein